MLSALHESCSSHPQERETMDLRIREDDMVFVYVRVRLKHNMEWAEGRLADVYTFRNGKAIQMRAFADRRQALEWAGVKASDAN